MIDIDEVVLDACSRFMPSVCGEYLARRKGDNYEVIVGDAFKHMEEMRVRTVISKSLWKYIIDTQKWVVTTR